MKRSAIIFVLLSIFVFTTFETEAQRRNKYKRRRTKSKSISHYRGGSVGGRFRPYAYAGFNVNALNYYGDLAPVNRAASTDVSFTRPGFGFEVGYKFHAYAAFRASFNWGRLKGDDLSSYQSNEEEVKWQARYARGLSFRNDIKEVSAGFELYFLPNYGGPNVRPPINAYLFIGGAIFHHEPRGLVPDLNYQSGGTEAPPQAGEWVKLRELGTEGQNLDDGGYGEVYLPISFAIPIAIGAKLRLPGPFDAGVELGYRFVFTDYLDDVSTNYVGLERFDDELARVMSDRSSEPVSAWTGEERDNSVVNIVQTDFPNGENYFFSGYVGGGNDGEIRGNPDNNDMYFVTSLKIRYIIGKTRRSSAKFR